MKEKPIKIKHCHQKVDYYGDCNIAVLLSREDFEGILKEPEKLTDDEMYDLAEHFGEAIMGDDWKMILEIVAEGRLDDYEKRKK